MSKITKKQLHNGWHCHDTEIIKMKKELRELKQSVLRLEKLTDEKLLDEPQPKQLDQSVFNGLDEKWRFAVIQNNGFALICTKLPFVAFGGSSWDWNGYSDVVGKGYDASNWQNSLIERDTAKELLEVDLSSELTGSELCKAMLERGDKYVMCQCWDSSYADIEQVVDVINGFECTAYRKLFAGNRHSWENAIPINNQGEPLTAAEAGF